MKLYFMKKEALDFLKSNLSEIYNMYYTEEDNKWLWKVYGDNPFVEFKEIQDFQLAPIDSNLSKGEVEFNNCKIMYKNLSFLTESQACDERLWAGLCHSIYYNYLRRRWDYDKKTPKSPKEAVSNIKSRFFFSGGTRAGLYRNSMAKCWWVGRNTYDASKVNSFEKLDIIGSADISTKISDIFYSNNFSANPVILSGIVKALKNFNDEKIPISIKEHIRPSLQLLNAIGGSIVLDCLDENEIADIIIDNVYGIIQGDEQGVETEIELEEDVETDSGETDIYNIENDNEIEDEGIVLGQKVKVRIKETGEIKEIVINYLPNSSKMALLAKKLLGSHIGDEVLFQSKTYCIEEVINH